MTLRKPAGHFIRTLNLWDAVAIVICNMIGSGIFIVSSQIAADVQSAGFLLLSWIIGGVMTIIGALTYGEFAACWPQVGGQYIYLKNLWGELTAFLFGWSLFLILNTGSIAAVAIGFSKFLSVLSPAFSASFTQKAIAVLLVIILSAINMKGIKLVSRIQNMVTVSNLVALLAIIICGIILGFQSHAFHLNFAHPWAVPHLSAGLPIAMGMAMVGAMFCLDGWSNVTFIAAEIKKPARNLPLALLFGAGLVALLYVLVNAAYLSVLPLSDIVNAKDGVVGSAFMQRILGTGGQTIITLVILVAAFGCMNSIILSGPRVLYAMAEDGLFFKNLSKLGEKSGVPENAILCQGLWSLFLVLNGSFSDMMDYMVFASMLFYILSVGGLFVLRKKYSNLPRVYRAWGYPVLPILYCLICLYIAVSLLIGNPFYSLMGLLVVLTGIPIYFLWKKAPLFQPMALLRRIIKSPETEI